MADSMPEREAKRDPSFILRSNSISVVLTLLALAATVAGVYLLSPRLDNALMTRSAEEHRAAQEFDIVNTESCFISAPYTYYTFLEFINFASDV